MNVMINGILIDPQIMEFAQELTLTETGDTIGMMEVHLTMDAQIPTMDLKHFLKLKIGKYRVP